MIVRAVGEVFRLQYLRGDTLLVGTDRSVRQWRAVRHRNAGTDNRLLLRRFLSDIGRRRGRERHRSLHL